MRNTDVKVMIPLIKNKKISKFTKIRDMKLKKSFISSSLKIQHENDEPFKFTFRRYHMKSNEK
jgi:hypothetical protein